MISQRLVAGRFGSGAEAKATWWPVAYARAQVEIEQIVPGGAPLARQ